MKNFGFTINKDRQIDFDKNDRSLFNYIREREPDILICISCGTCTATCSANKYTEFGLRKIILIIKRGETANLKKEMAKCMMCGKCQIACPREVNTRNLILNIKKALLTYNEI